MRLTDDQIQSIRRTVHDLAGADTRVRLFGSRLRDDLAGGDVDLLVELPNPVDAPAELSARISARISRAQHGRRVDVVLLAPNLRRLPIHEVALKEGRLL
jgi:predicted nucleotidyltransferase